MPEQCDKCGVEYTPMILEKLSRGSKIGAAIETFSYVVLGGYAFACYYFSDSIIMLFFCTILALLLYHFSSPVDKGYCDNCIDANRKNNET